MKTPDAIGGTDAQQQEYAAKVRTIRADQLGDAHLGRLVSLAGHPPRKLVGTYPARLPSGQPVMVLRWDALTESIATLDTEITIHPEA